MTLFVQLRFQFLVCSACAWLLTGLVYGAEKYSVEEKKAAVNVEVEAAKTKQLIELCIPQFEESGDVYKFYTFFWEADNLAERLVAKSLFSNDQALRNQADQEIKTWKESFSKNAGDAKPNASLCRLTLSDMKAGKFNFDKKIPKDAKILLAIFDKREGFRIEKRNIDMTVGCMKGLYNTGNRIYEKAKETCSCHTKAFTDNATDQEIDEWLKEVGKAKENQLGTLLEKEWMKRVTPALSACQETLP